MGHELSSNTPASMDQREKEIFNSENSLLPSSMFSRFLNSLELPCLLSPKTNHNLSSNCLSSFFSG